jgi:hypothetical protein
VQELQTGGTKARWAQAESPSRFRFLFSHDLRANVSAFVARENRYALFRIMLQRFRYTQTRAGGIFIQMRSEASVETPGSDFGIGGTTE